MEDIAKLFANLRFAKRIVGGIEERDVWKKLDEVQTAYRKVYEAQHERDLALIEERDKTIRELSSSLEQIKKLCGDSAAGVEIPNTPTPYQDNEPGVKGAARKSNQNKRSDMEGVSRKPCRDVKSNVKGIYRDSDPEIGGTARESVQNNNAVVKGASRKPDRNDVSDIEDLDLDQYRDNRPDVKGVSREPMEVRSSKEAAKAAPAMRNSIDSLSSDSLAEADLAFDWLDDGDFNL